MRNSGPTLILSLLCFFGFSLSSFGQLPTRSDLLVEKYEEDRAKGIIALNKRYITKLEKELNVAIAAKKLEEANWIQSKIQILKAEINDPNRSDTSSMTSIEDKTRDPNFLVGKKIQFPNNRDPSQHAYFSFQEDGRAVYIGMGNATVPREYEPTGKSREFKLTWPGRQDDFSTYIITVSPDGKSAELVLRYNNKTSAGVIQDAD